MSVSFATFYKQSPSLNAWGITSDSNNNIYIGDYNGRILKVNQSAVASLFCNTSTPISLTCDTNDNIYSSSGNTITKFTPAGSGSTYYSTGLVLYGMTFDTAGNLYACGGSVILKIPPGGGSATTFASGFNNPFGLVIDSLGNLYCSNNTGNSISKITPGGVVSTFVSITSPLGLAIDYADNIYAIYAGNNSLAKILPNATFTNIANSSFYAESSLTFDRLGYIYASQGNGNNGCNRSTTVVGVPRPQIQYPCFKKGSKILTDKGYKPIQDLRKGDLVKTFKSGYKPVSMVGKREIHHKANLERIKDQLYKLSKHRYPALWEDLILTGCHSILVDDFVSERQKEKTIQINGDAYLTEDKYRLPTCADEKATVYETPGKYTVYHVALENDSYYGNYGIYANGLLVESCSKRYLKELSNMNFVV
jgi:hypothetical protein